MPHEAYSRVGLCHSFSHLCFGNSKFSQSVVTLACMYPSNPNQPKPSCRHRDRLGPNGWPISGSFPWMDKEFGWDLGEKILWEWVHKCERKAKVASPMWMSARVGKRMFLKFMVSHLKVYMQGQSCVWCGCRCTRGENEIISVNHLNLPRVHLDNLGSCTPPRRNMKAWKLEQTNTNPLISLAPIICLLKLSTTL
jgi:hypothetical protein